MKNPALMIVDDDHMLAELLAAALEQDAGVRVVGLAGNATEALALAEQTRPDLILLDVEMPGTHGLDLIGPLQQKLSTVKIILLTSHLDPYTVYRVLQSGVQGYVEKPSPLRVLKEAVRRVLKGKTFFSAGFMAVKAQHLASAEAFHKILSDREQSILQHMAAGLNDADIAKRCGISEPTVGTHRKHIRVKLEVHSDRDLLTYTRRWGLGLKGPVLKTERH